MNRELWLSQIRENVRRHNKRERVVEAFGESSELVDRKEKIARFSRGLETKYRDALEEAQNSSVTIEELSTISFSLNSLAPLSITNTLGLGEGTPLI